MIYAMRHDEYRRTLVQITKDKWENDRPANLERVTAKQARFWVKRGWEHETGLWVDLDGKVRYAPAEGE